jgi:hypothetical protein
MEKTHTWREIVSQPEAWRGNCVLADMLGLEARTRALVEDVSAFGR